MNFYDPAVGDLQPDIRNVKFFAEKLLIEMNEQTMMNPRTVLVVDDDSDIREAISQILEYEGYEVQTASNGQEGLAALENDRPGLILLDLMMPVMNGWQFKTAMDSNPKLNDIPVVVLSADGNIAQKTENIKIAGYLRKPIQLDTLLETVKHHCN